MLGFLTCLAVPESLAEVQLSLLSSPIEVATSVYQARIDPDGCLSSLRASGHEFLAPGVSISRGSYFYQGGPLRLAQLRESAPNEVAAESPQASIRYEFRETQMQWTLENRTEQAMVFFLVLAEDIDAVAWAQDELALPAVEQDVEQATFFRAGTALRLEGVDRIWGPWQGEHQVAQVSLAAAAKRTLTLHFAPASRAQQTAINELQVPLAEPPLAILSPRNYQVIQRHSEQRGTVLVSGRSRIKAALLEYRIAGNSRFGELPTTWQALPTGTTGDFNSLVALPAGGWYRLEIQAKQGNEIVGQAQIARFGVGEVFVGAGQSNSTNSGQFRTQQTSGMVSSFSGSDWQLADDPQPGVADRSQGGSFWPAFGDALFERYQVPIGVATTGFGGTSVNQWQPEEHLFGWTLTRIHQLGPLGFRALLWHQGESDVQMPSEEYYTKLKTVIVTSRQRAGWEFPWFVAQASYHNPDQPRFESVRSAQARLWAEGIALEGPDTDTLDGDHRDLDGKGIHFSRQGLAAHGRMWAAKVIARWPPDASQ
jgi:hypothetical protein